MINLRQSRIKPAKLRLTAVVISTVITVFPEKIKPTVNSLDSKTRVRPRFFDQVGHETMYASSENNHFFTKSCHLQTYQNYEQS